MKSFKKKIEFLFVEDLRLQTNQDELATDCATCRRRFESDDHFMFSSVSMIWFNNELVNTPSSSCELKTNQLKNYKIFNRNIYLTGSNANAIWTKFDSISRWSSPIHTFLNQKKSELIDLTSIIFGWFWFGIN